MNRAISRISRIFKKKTELQKALTECRHAAREGFETASNNLDGIKEDIDEIAIDLKQHLTRLNNGKIRTTDIERQTPKTATTSGFRALFSA